MWKLTNEDLQMMNLFERHTRARATDVVSAGNAIVFIVRKGDLTKSIGKRGTNIARLNRFFGKKVEVIEGARDLKGFLANVFYPAQVKGFATLTMDSSASGGASKKIIQVEVGKEKKGLAIGKGGERIRLARTLAKRYFDFDDLRIL